MHVAELGRQLVIGSVHEAAKRVNRDPVHWNVVSIMDPSDKRPSFAGAKRVLPLSFDDVEDDQSVTGSTLVRSADLSSAFRFWDETEGEPVLVHCFAGVSRSTGLTMALIARELWGEPDLVSHVARLLIRIRPQAHPNRRVLQLGLEQFLTREESVRMTPLLLNAIAREQGREASV
jgi:predicted protein tyrosine phosphatase